MLEYIVGTIIALLFIGLIAFTSVRHQGKAHAAPVSGETVSMSSPALTPLIAGSSLKETLKARLETISKNPPPKDLKTGAMCYSMVGPPNRIEYVCPSCGDKSLYARDTSDADRGLVTFLTFELQQCREMVKKLKDLHISLDEHEFCRKCSPAAKTPVLRLKISYPGEKTHVVRGIHGVDLQLLIEFMNGSDRHDSGMMGEKPLKDYVPRLRELLGIQ